MCAFWAHHISPSYCSGVTCLPLGSCRKMPLLWFMRLYSIAATHGSLNIAIYTLIYSYHANITIHTPIFLPRKHYDIYTNPLLPRKHCDIYANLLTTQSLRYIHQIYLPQRHYGICANLLTTQTLRYVRQSTYHPNITVYISIYWLRKHYDIYANLFTT